MPTSTPLLDSIELPGDLRQVPAGQLRQVADELRCATIDAVSVTGGHFGSGLGVVELTVALHYVFQTPRDRVIWDVGHQAYPHKILTCRRDRIPTLRQRGGLPGSPRRAESEYDPFGAAHASTSISSSLGMAVARELDGGDHHVVAVIGDGAMSAGMAYEAMNNAGARKTRLLVILNDNEMSIAPPVGALHRHLNGLTGKPAEPGHATPSGGTLFEALGFHYVGPIDGHDMDGLVAALTAIRDDEADRPVLLHLVTEKGHGYHALANSTDSLHAVAKFDVASG